MQIERTNFNGSWNDICPFCGEKQEKHKIIIPGEKEGLKYEHRKPCEQEKQSIQEGYKREATIVRSWSLIIWVLIPLFIIVFGFANIWIGFTLFIYSLFKIIWKLLEIYGRPEKWLQKCLPGYKEKKEKEFKMRHYYYHCERNPEGFLRLKVENFKKEENEELKK